MYLHVLCEIPLINKFDTLPLTELWNCMRLFVLQHPHSTLSEMTKKERHQKRNDSRVGRDRYSQRLFAGWFKALSIKASDKLFGTLLRGNYIRKGRNSRVSIDPSLFIGPISDRRNNDLFRFYRRLLFRLLTKWKQKKRMKLGVASVSSLLLFLLFFFCLRFNFDVTR